MLEPYEEPKAAEPKYHIGQRMYIKFLNKIGTIDIVQGYNEEEVGIYYHLKIEPEGVASAREDFLEPYTEPDNQSRNLSLSEQQEAAWNNIPSKLKEKIESKYAEYSPEAFNGFAVGYCAAIRDILGYDRFGIIK